MVGKIVPSRAALTVLASLAFSSFTSASTTCYYPNGNVALTYQPCYPISGSDTACCELQTSACSTTGYCYGSAGVMYRGGCTDQTWTSSSCPSECVDVNSQSFSNINLCPGGTQNQFFTCSGSGEFTLNMCLTNFTFNAGIPFIQNSTVAPSTSTSTPSSTSSANTSSTTSCPTATAVTQGTCTTPVVVGLATGIPLGLLAAFLALVVFWQHRKYSNRSEGSNVASSYQPPPQGVVWETQNTSSAQTESSSHQQRTYYEPDSTTYYETDSNTWQPKPRQASQPSEMATPLVVHELR